MHLERATRSPSCYGATSRTERLLPHRPPPTTSEVSRVLTRPTSVPGAPKRFREKDDRGPHRQRRPRDRAALAMMWRGFGARFAGWLGLAGIVNPLETSSLAGTGRVAGRRRHAIPLSCAPARGADISLFITNGAPMRPASHPAERRREVRAALAELAVGNFDDILAGLDETRICGRRRSRASRLPGRGLGAMGRRAFAAFAAITGMKSPWLRDHSTGCGGSPRRPAGCRACRTLRHDPTARRTRARPGRVGRLEPRSGRSRDPWVRGRGARRLNPLHERDVRPVAGARLDRNVEPAHTMRG